MIFRVIHTQKNMLSCEMLPLHSCQTACYWISSQFHQNQNHIYQFLEKKRSPWITVQLREFLCYLCVCSAAWRRTQVQSCLTGGPADATQTLVMAGYLIVVLPWTEKDNSSWIHYLSPLILCMFNGRGWSLFQLSLSERQGTPYVVCQVSLKSYTPLVTPFVERQPCHSLNSLLWQHNPSGPIAERIKTC